MAQAKLRPYPLEGVIARNFKPYVHFSIEEAVQSKLFLQIFAVIGVIYISVKVFSFLRLLVSVFLLPGKGVSFLCSKGQSGFYRPVC